MRRLHTRLRACTRPGAGSRGKNLNFLCSASFQSRGAGLQGRTPHLFRRALSQKVRTALCVKCDGASERA